MKCFFKILLVLFVSNFLSISKANAEGRLTNYESIYYLYSRAYSHFGKQGFTCLYHKDRLERESHICTKHVSPTEVQRFFGARKVIKKIVLERRYSYIKRYLKVSPKMLDELVRHIKVYSDFNYKDYKKDFWNAEDAILEIFPLGSNFLELKKTLNGQGFECFNNANVVLCRKSLRTANYLFMPWTELKVVIYHDNDNKIENVITRSVYTGL